ncbi:MAG: hypothetical protein LBS32_08205, partial [Clostridiales Family XIII bacterium]|nr:hypothetical protein [Clostridiales Family XIII bacterium]
PAGRIASTSAAAQSRATRFLVFFKIEAPFQIYAYGAADPGAARPFDIAIIQHRLLKWKEKVQKTD